MMQVRTTSSMSSSDGGALGSAAAAAAAASQQPSWQGGCRLSPGLQLCASCSSQAHGRSSHLCINSGCCNHQLHGFVRWLQALQEVVSRGADPANIRVVAVVAAPPALKLMADAYPGQFWPAKGGSSSSLIQEQWWPPHAAVAAPRNRVSTGSGA
jgi:hypothetical protein